MSNVGTQLERLVVGVENIQDLEDELVKNASIAIEFHHSKVWAIFDVINIRFINFFLSKVLFW